MRTRFTVNYKASPIEIQPMTVDVWIEGPLHLAQRLVPNEPMCLALEESARVALVAKLGGDSLVDVASGAGLEVRPWWKQVLSKQWCPEFVFEDGELEPAYYQPSDHILPTMLTASLARALRDALASGAVNGEVNVYAEKSPHLCLAAQVSPTNGSVFLVWLREVCVQQVPMGNGDWTWMIELQVERGHDGFMVPHQSLKRLISRDESRKPNLVYAYLRDMLDRVSGLCVSVTRAYEPQSRCDFRDFRAPVGWGGEDFLWKCQEHRVMVAELFPFYRQVPPIDFRRFSTPERFEQSLKMTEAEAAASRAALLVEIQREQAQREWLQAQALADLDGEPPAATHCIQHGTERIIYACSSDKALCHDSKALAPLRGYTPHPASDVQALIAYMNTHRFWAADALEVYRALALPLMAEHGCTLGLRLSKSFDGRPNTLDLTLIVPDDHPRLDEFSFREFQEYLHNLWTEAAPELWNKYWIHDMLGTETKTYTEWTDEK